MLRFAGSRIFMEGQWRRKEKGGLSKPMSSPPYYAYVESSEVEKSGTSSPAHYYWPTDCLLLPDLFRWLACGGGDVWAEAIRRKILNSPYQVNQRLSMAVIIQNDTLRTVFWFGARGSTDRSTNQPTQRLCLRGGGGVGWGGHLCSTILKV